MRDRLGRRMSRHCGIPFMGSASCVNGSPRRVFDVNIMLVKAMFSYLTRVEKTRRWEVQDIGCALRKGRERGEANGQEPDEDGPLCKDSSASL